MVKDLPFGIIMHPLVHAGKMRLPQFAEHGRRDDQSTLRAKVRTANDDGIQLFANRLVKQLEVF